MRVLKTLLFCFLCFQSFAEDINFRGLKSIEPGLNLYGPNVVDPGSQIYYEVTFPYSINPASNIIVNVNGGGLVDYFVDHSSGTVKFNVSWNSTSSVGSIEVYDDLMGMGGSWSIQVGAPIVTPAVQSVNYGTVPGQLYAYLAFYDNTSFQWQQSFDQSSWVNVGTNYEAYVPPAVFGPVYYRCIATINSVPYYTNEVAIYLNPLTAGSISLGQQPAYNTVAAISNIPANGGFCYTSDYQYVWEQQVENGPWTVIGNTANYPANASPIIGFTRIRRKITCAWQTLYTNTLEITPAYTGVDYENRNYIRTNTIATRDIQSWYQADQLDVGKKFQETVYFDGLGRTIQTVTKGISSDANGAWKDVVSFTDYDNEGRPLRQNLPYPTASQPGKFKTNTAEQQIFYAANYNEPSPWGKSVYEDNPLNRVKKTIEPGDYRLNNTIGNSFEHDFNNSNGIDEKVHIWRIGYAQGDIPVTTATDVYQIGTLMKSVIMTDQNKKVIVYTDVSGNVVMKKTQLKEVGNGLTNEHDGWLCTYYVHDGFHRLRFIITPKAVAYLDANNWQLSQAIADELCFAYEYDGKGRVISKKTPGVASTKLVYDLRDRVVFSQDGNQSNKEWLVSFYDDLDRVVETGVYTSTKTRGGLQTDMDLAVTTTTITIGGTPTSPRTLSVTGLRDVSSPIRYLAGESIEFSDFSSYNNDAFVAEIEPFVPGSFQSITVYLNPQPPVNVNSTATYLALAYTYYDDYNFAGAKPFNTGYNNQQAYAASDPDIEAIVKTSRTRGLATGSKVRVLNTNTFLNTTIYYDEQGAVLQTLGDNYKSGTDIVTSQYHFDGRVMSTHVQHGTAGGIFNGFGILTKNVYDKIGRLKTLYKKFGTAGFKKIAEYAYDEMGDLKTRKLGEKPNGIDPLETLEYSYNATGELTGINKAYALSGNNTDQWNNYFGLYLGYENFDGRFNNGRFDHLITGTIWKSQGDNAPRRYDYTYDNASRYTAANFTQKVLPSEPNWSNTKMDFSENNIEYDENGNLKKLYRKGVLAGIASPLDIDKLNYTYKVVAGGEWSNQLLKVFDNNPSVGAVANGKQGDFKDEVFNSNVDDYRYDANGNLEMDNNKKIRNGSGAGITYNILNKPEKIIIENKSVVEFTYDATGNKLAKKVTPASGTAKTTYYIGEFIYEDNDLQYIIHEEGRLRVMDPVSSTTPLGAAAQIITGNILLNGNKWGVFDYFIKDHSGSTRMVISEEYHKEIFKCTMEDVADSEEASIFGKVDNNGNPLADNEVRQTRKDNQGWESNTSQKVSKLLTTGTAGTTSIGPNVLLKVMAGDYINAESRYYYEVPLSDVTNTSILNSIVTSIIGGFTGGSINQAVKDAGSSLQTTFQNPSSSPLIPFLSNQPAQPTNRPKAYLNYIFFDENFNYIQEGSGAELVDPTDNDDKVKALYKRAPKNGYVYVYLSNESNWPVQFDDFTVTHERGAIVEESHYYPFGMKIAAISSRAYNKPLNKYGFQGDFSEEEEETGYNEFDLRMYDPQTGRWLQSDPYDEFASGYVGMGNDPVNNVDPDGGSISGGGMGALIGMAVGFAAPYAYELITGNEVKNKGLWGALGAVAGAGIGYGIGNNLATGGDDGIWASTRAFYEGLFGGGDGWVHAHSGPTNQNAHSFMVEVPNIWGNLPVINPPFRDFTIPPLPALNINPSIVRGLVTNSQPIQIPTPPYKPANTPKAKKRPKPQEFKFTIDDDFKYSVSPLDRSLSREQIAISNQIKRLIQRAVKRAGFKSFRIKSIQATVELPAEYPIGDNLIGNSGNVWSEADGTRIDDPNPKTDNLDRMRPINGAGFTPIQNLLEQGRKIAERAVRDFSTPATRVLPATPNSNGKTYRITFDIKGAGVKE